MDVESLGNGIQSFLRNRAVTKRSDSTELKSAIKCASGSDRFSIVSSNAHHQKQTCPNGDYVESNNFQESGRDSPESGEIGRRNSDDKSLIEVEYKSTYPIDEPIEAVLNSSNNGSTSSNARPTSLFPNSPTRHRNHKNSKTFPVDRECCDVNEPCEEHEHDYFGDIDDESFPNGDPSLQYSGYENKVF